MQALRKANTFQEGCGIVFRCERGWMDSKLNRCGYYLLAVLATSVGAFAQDHADVAQDNASLTGIWMGIFTDTAPQGRCGQEVTYAELEVTGTIADAKRPTYEAVVTAWKSHDRCLNVTKVSSKAKLVARGSNVSLSYEAEDWGSEMLVHNGDTMSGIDATGHSLEWHRPAELPVSLQTNMVRQNIVNDLTKRKVEKIEADIVAGGKSAEEAAEIAAKIVDGFAGCIVEIVQVQAAVQRLPYEELLKMYDPVSSDEANPRVVRRLDKKAVEARSRACFFEVTGEFGVEITQLMGAVPSGNIGVRGDAITVFGETGRQMVNNVSWNVVQNAGPQASNPDKNL